MKKTVLVTGASRGIGRQIAYDFAKAGYNVCINYLNSEKEARGLEEELLDLKSNVFIYKADVSDRAQVDLMIDEVLKRYNTIDIVINNAGVAEYKLFTDIDENSYNRMLDVHLKGTFNVTQSALKKYMINKKDGKIINISSIWGVVGGSCEVHYSAAKSGIIGLTKALAKELGPSNITVNAVAPGVIKTDMLSDLNDDEVGELIKQIPLSRLGNVQDVSNLVMFLASENSNYISGQVISVDGAMAT